MKKRLFIAIHINNSESLLEHLNKAKLCLGAERIKWVEPENLHLTLTFLGDTDEQFIPKINSSLQSTATRYNQFTLKLHSLGVFKNLTNPSVLWMGIEAEKTIFDIKKELDIKLIELGLPVESRVFKPHLTIGRIKNISDRKNLHLLLENMKNRFVSKHLISELILFESKLTPEGPNYKVINKVLLR
jgi:RNA 2',3'-cyclic 3'-phosphodiesterase